MLIARSFLIVLLLSTFLLRATGQTVFWTENFESSAPSSGTRSASNHADDKNGSSTAICGLGDYFYRMNQASDTPHGVSIAMSGFSGFYWRGEDLDGCIGNPDEILFSDIDISGLSGFRFTGSFGANPANLWESSDGILVEYSIDGSAYQPGLAIHGDINSRLSEDTDGDNVGDGTVLDANLTDLSFTFGSTGSTLSLRLTAIADQGSEEFAFDHFMLEHGVPLPVRLRKFSVYPAAGQSVHLSWETEQEQDNEGFYVERSKDGSTWHEVAFIKGHGNSDHQQLYNYTDTQPLDGRSFYRLRQQDFDGQMQYSLIRAIQFSTNTTWPKLSPNPFFTETALQWYRTEPQTMDVVLRTISGKQLQYWQFELDAGQQQLVLPLANLPTGMYVIQLSNGQQRQSMPLIKH